MCCLNSPELWELPWGAARLCHIPRGAQTSFEIWCIQTNDNTTFNRINCWISYLNDAEDCVHINNRDCHRRLCWCLWPSGGRGPSIMVTITLSSSARSITINYHNSGDHWPPLSISAQAIVPRVPTSRAIIPDLNTCVSYHDCEIEKLFCSHGMFLYRFDKQFMSFFMLWLVNGCILCNMKVFFQFVFTSQTMETTSWRQWFRAGGAGWQGRVWCSPVSGRVSGWGPAWSHGGRPGSAGARLAWPGPQAGHTGLCMARGGPECQPHTVCQAGPAAGRSSPCNGHVSFVKHL